MLDYLPSKRLLLENGSVIAKWSCQGAHYMILALLPVPVPLPSCYLFKQAVAYPVAYHRFNIRRQIACVRS